MSAEPAAIPDWQLERLLARVAEVVDSRLAWALSFDDRLRELERLEDGEAPPPKLTPIPGGGKRTKRRGKLTPAE